MRKLLIIAVLSVFCIGLAQAQYRHNNTRISIFGPNFGFSHDSGHHHSLSSFYLEIPIQRPMTFGQPAQVVRQFQQINFVTCYNDLYADFDGFGNQISPQYRICWGSDQFGNQISPQYRQY